MEKVSARAENPSPVFETAAIYVCFPHLLFSALSKFSFIVVVAVVVVYDSFCSSRYFFVFPSHPVTATICRDASPWLLYL